MKKLTDKIRNNSICDNLLWIIPMLFYIFFWLFDGVVWCADTNSYVELNPSREPLYPIFLSLFRGIFGAEMTIWNGQYLYLFVAVGVQSIFAAVSTSVMAFFLRKEYKLDAFASYTVMALPLMTSLLCRFAANRASMYTNSIMTESLAISLYLLFFRFLIDYVIHHSHKAMWACILLSFIGISVRKQMLVCLALIIIGIIYVSIKTKSGLLKGLINVVLLSVLVIACVKALDLGYNKIVRGKWMTHTEDNRFITTMAIYTADREYVEHIEPRLKELFLQIYDICDENEWLMNAEPTGIYNRSEHFSNNYDHIQLDTMQQILLSVKDTGEYNFLGEGEVMDLIRESFNESLLPHEVGRLLKVFAINFITGMVTTVSQNKPIFYWYTLLAFAAYIGLLVRNIVKEHRVSTASMMGICVLIGIIGNVSLVSAVIFCQTRYTIYNMALFYMAMMVMLADKRKCGNEKLITISRD